MRIWVIGRAFPGIENNFNGSFEYEQAVMLKRHGNDVSYFCVETVPFYRRTEKAGITHFMESGISIYKHYFPYQPLPPELMVWIRDILLRRMMKKCSLETGQTPDIIHVHYPSLMGAGFFFEYHKMGAKVLCTEHWTKVLSSKLNTVYRQSLRMYREYSDGIISVGKPLNDRIEYITDGCKHKCPTYVVPNVVDDSFSYAQVENEQCFTFIAIGRLVFCKRFDMLINAFDKAFAHDDNVHLTIVGNGPEYNNLKDLVRIQDNEGRVELTGGLPHDIIPIKIHQSNVLVCSSNLETFGVPVIEALCCGRPVITTKAIGFLEYMNDSAGIVVETDSESQMIDALINIRRNYHDFNLKKISNSARRLFSEEAVYERLQSIYSM